MADISVSQMALTRDTGPGGFMERVTAILVKVAGTILSEPFETKYHQQRAMYCQRVVAGPQQAATQAGPQVVMHQGIIGYTVYDEETKVSTMTGPDTVIETAITELWNALAGIDTPT